MNSNNYYKIRFLLLINELIYLIQKKFPKSKHNIYINYFCQDYFTSIRSYIKIPNTENRIFIYQFYLRRNKIKVKLEYQILTKNKNNINFISKKHIPLHKFMKLFKISEQDVILQYEKIEFNSY